MQHDAANATRDAVDVSAAGVIGGARRGAASALDPELAELWAVHPEQYEIFGEIARGGMGRILEARDVRHARFIAIKMLLGDSPEAARRFAREARITARLQHPAIVTLYESGRWPSGEPYLALKLIVGRPLRDAVAETRTLIARLELLPHLIAVAEAIAYAHGEGVVHRDLKPSNVLIGAFGETVVIDWGLARERDEPDDGAPTVPSSDFVVRSSAGARARTHDLTVAGSAIGTPCYMAPEQARGERVEASADVYSLGAMLYHVFSGAPPYAEAPPGNALARVLEGPPRPLSELAPDLPRELATIVDKAMAREPADRYATADELARDLKRYAAGQRVAVHSYSFAALARRWAARHRITLGVAASLLLALAVVGVSSVRRIARERDRAETARASADAARTAAENQRAAATLQRDAAARLVDFMLVDLRSRLEPIGKLDVLATVAGEVEGYYESVSSSAPDAPTMWRRGTALASIGRVDEARGDGAAARRKYEAAVALAAHALALESANEPARALVAEAHALLAALDVEEGKLDDAVREREGARAAARALVLAHPDDVRWRMLSAEVQIGTGWLDAQRGDLATADAVWLSAIEELGRVLAIDPAHKRAKVALVEAWASSSGCARQLGHMEEATLRLTRALEANDASAQGPDDYEARSRRIEIVQELASVELEQGQPRAALVKLREARESLRKLTAHDPSNLGWLKSASTADSNICRAFSTLGDLASARAHCAAAVVIAERLLDLQGGRSQSRFHLGVEYRRLGSVELARGDAGAAVAAFERSRRLFAEVIADTPSNAGATLFLAKAQRSLAAAFLADRRYDAASESVRAGLETARTLLRSSPANAIAQVVLAALQELEGALAAARGDARAARDSYLDAQATLRTLAGRGTDMKDALVVGERVARCVVALDARRVCEVARVVP